MPDTPPIPEAALKAAVEAMATVLQAAEARDDAPSPATSDIAWWCADVAGDMLTAALPLLGETRQQWAVRYTDSRGRAHYALQDTEAAARTRPLEGDTVVSRTITTGPWTEAP